MKADPKPTRRYVATRPEWAHFHATLVVGRRCECGCGRPAESLHHLVGRGQGGDDVPANLVALAGDGTRLCHGAITSANRTYDPDRREYIDPAVVRRGIRRNLDLDQTAYVVGKQGWDWLDLYYPREDG